MHIRRIVSDLFLFYSILLLLLLHILNPFYIYIILVWSLGIIVYELLVGSRQSASLGKQPTLPHEIMADEKNSLFVDVFMRYYYYYLLVSLSINQRTRFSCFLILFLYRCTQQDPLKRPSAVELIRELEGYRDFSNL